MLRSSNKADASEIVAFLDELSEQPWLDARKKAWPNYIYHFNDIRNIASVLQQGVLCSRERCRTSGISFIDVADRLVVSESPWTHSYSRFYFRPHTPTQYLQEGIRPPSFRSNEAHCPVPVFLLFRSRELLIRSDMSLPTEISGLRGTMEEADGMVAQHSCEECRGERSIMTRRLHPISGAL